MTRVGFLGLGRMGRPVAGNIAAAGHHVVLWNRTREVAETLARDLSADVADDPADAAEQADVVLTMVADDAAVADVYLGSRGLAAALSPGKVAADLSTVSPVTTERIAGAVHSAGAAFVDAPVSGSTATAEAGELTVMAGGDEAGVAQVRPVLQATSKAIYHVGPNGAGAVMKLAVNSIIYGLNQALSEALVLAERSGIEREVAYEVFANSAIAAPVVHYRRPAFEHPGVGPVSFRLALATKDLRLIEELAQRVGVQMPQASSNLHTAAEAEQDGFAEWDLAGLAEWLRRTTTAAAAASEPEGRTR